MPSFYQLDLFQELASTEQVDLKIIFARDLPPDRKMLGWREELDERLDVCFLDPSRLVLDAMRRAWQQRTRIHIVNGIWAEPPFTAALAVLRIACSHYFIYAEAPNPSRRRNFFKRLLRKISALLLVNTSRAALLAVSSLSKEFYRDYGFEPERIFDFGYFRSNHGTDPIVDIGSETQLIYVGQLTRRKRVDLLLEAAAPLLRTDFTIKIVGDGEERARLADLVTSLGVDKYVHFLGVIPSDHVTQIISRASALVLPSEHDGWGLVVNESLMVGIPAIVSDGCGAADVIKNGKNGFVFRKGNVQSLRSTLRAFLLADQRELRRNAYATGQSLSTYAASRYLISCLNYKLNPRNTRPIPPWNTSEERTYMSEQRNYKST